MQTDCALLTPATAIGASTLNSLLAATLREVLPSIECWLVGGDSYKDVVTSTTVGCEITFLTMLLSLPMMGRVVTPYDLAARVTIFRRSSSITGSRPPSRAHQSEREREKRGER